MVLYIGAVHTESVDVGVETRNDNAEICRSCIEGC